MALRRDTETSFLDEDIAELTREVAHGNFGRDRRHSIGRITENPSYMYTAPYGGSDQAGTSSITLVCTYTNASLRRIEVALWYSIRKFLCIFQDNIDELSALQSVRLNLVWWWIGFFASLIAAFLFFIGSFFFLPSMAPHINAGCYMFVTGVLLFWATSAWSAWNYRSRHADAITNADLLAKKVKLQKP